MIMTTIHGEYTQAYDDRGYQKAKHTPACSIKSSADLSHTIELHDKLDSGITSGGGTSSKTMLLCQDNGEEEDQLAAGSELTRNGKRKRVSRACDACFAKKDRCDAAQPVCKVCRQLDRACTYDRPERKRGPAQGIRQRLEAQIEMLESVLGYIDTTYPHISHDLVTQRFQLERGEVSARAHAQQLDGLASPRQASDLPHSHPQPPLYVPPGDIFPSGMTKAQLRDHWRQCDLSKSIAPCLGLELRSHESQSSGQSLDSRGVFVKSEDDGIRTKQSNVEAFEEHLFEAKNARIRLTRATMHVPGPSLSPAQDPALDDASFDDAVKYVDYYFNSWHATFSFLNAKAIASYCSDLARSQLQPAQRALVLAIGIAGRCSCLPPPLGARSLLQSSQEETRKIERAAVSVHRLLIGCDFCREAGQALSDGIEAIQAYVVLSFVDLWLGRLQRAWSTIGIAARLQQQCENLQTTANEQVFQIRVAIFTLDTILSIYFGHRPSMSCNAIESGLQQEPTFSKLASLALAASRDQQELEGVVNGTHSSQNGGRNLSSWAHHELPGIEQLFQVAAMQEELDELTRNITCHDESMVLFCAFLVLDHRLGTIMQRIGKEHLRLLQCLATHIAHQSLSGVSPLCMVTFDLVGYHLKDHQRTDAACSEERKDSSDTQPVTASISPSLDTIVTAASWAVAAQTPCSVASSIAFPQVQKRPNLKPETSGQGEVRSLSDEIADGSLALYYALGGPMITTQSHGMVFSSTDANRHACIQRTSSPPRNSYDRRQPATTPAKSPCSESCWRDSPLRLTMGKEGLVASMPPKTASDASQAWQMQPKQADCPQGISPCHLPTASQTMPYSCAGQVQANVRVGTNTAAQVSSFPAALCGNTGAHLYTDHFRLQYSQDCNVGTTVYAGASMAPMTAPVTTALPQHFVAPHQPRHERSSLVQANTAASFGALVSPTGMTATSDSIVSSTRSTAAGGLRGGTMLSQLSTTTLEDAAVASTFSTSAGASASWRMPPPQIHDNTTAAAPMIAFSAAQAYADVTSASTATNSCQYVYGARPLQSRSDPSRFQ